MCISLTTVILGDEFSCMARYSFRCCIQLRTFIAPPVVEVREGLMPFAGVPALVGAHDLAGAFVQSDCRQLAPPYTSRGWRHMNFWSKRAHREFCLAEPRNKWVLAAIYCLVKLELPVELIFLVLGNIEWRTIGI
jgi:hypothetical protein